MSLFGALSSGVSGLSAQSSAIGAISDNITNVSTIGYKNTTVDFQTLVTKQTSSSMYSAGGVQSKPRQDAGIQGLLASTSSATDVAISGSGFFVVNGASKPGITDEFLFTRSGSFFQDNEGFLRNTSGYFLQAWPTDSAGTIIPANQDLTVPNQNVISSDFLTTVNLNRVGGTASSTSKISVGANLPTNDAKGTTRKTDVQFFDTLGNATTMNIINTKTGVDNQWDMSVAPPPGTSAIALQDAASLVYGAQGQLEFKLRPADTANVKVDTITYEFDTTAIAFTAGQTTAVTGTNTITAGGGAEFSVFKAGDRITLSGSAAGANNTTHTIASVSANGRVITVTGTGMTNQGAEAAGVVTFTYAGFTETATRKRVNVATNTNDSDYDTTNKRVKLDTGNATTLIFTEDGTGQISIDPTGLLTTSGTPAANQDKAFIVDKINAKYAKSNQITFTAAPANAETVIINGTTYTFNTNEATASGYDNDTTIRIDTIANMLQDLEQSIEANDASFPSGGAGLRRRDTGNNGSNNTLALPTLDTGSYNVKFSTGFTNIPAEPDGTASYAAGTDTVVSTTNSLTFDSDGIPASFSVTQLEVRGYTNGAADMDGDPTNASKIALDLGLIGQANGFTQFGSSFTPSFITQNGSQFGTFAGVTIAADGLVTALFDNGETRPVFKIPVATFVNVNGLGGQSGNIWNSTQSSGDPTLRNPDNGPAGQINQGTLEQSTVDIGSEFTKMIVVQRAFSASAKIITTADEMLEELLRTKR
jgi:flagellar hook protein FlgE